MSYFTDLRDSVEQSVGISTGTDAAQTIGDLVGQAAVAINQPAAPAAPAPSVPKTISQVITGNKVAIAGFSIPVIVLVGVAAFFFLKD